MATTSPSSTTAYAASTTSELGSGSLVPIESLATRVKAWHEVTGHEIACFTGDLMDADFTHDTVRDFRPDAIVHFAEQRAAPYSMIDRKHAVYTQTNNIVGTLNVMYAIAEIDRDIHLVKLGTMGEYGTPNIDIEEGWLEVEHKGRTDRVLFPKRPGPSTTCRRCTTATTSSSAAASGGCG